MSIANTDLNIFYQNDNMELKYNLKMAFKCLYTQNVYSVDVFHLLSLNTCYTINARERITCENSHNRNNWSSGIVYAYNEKVGR